MKTNLIALFLLSSPFASARDNVPETIVDYYVNQFSEDCDTELMDNEYHAPSKVDIPHVEASLYQFTCLAGAYNFTHVFIRMQQNGNIDTLSFAEPAFGENAVTGIRTTKFLTNAHYDQDKSLLVQLAKGRGIGDAFTYYEFSIDEYGSASLVKADVDDTFDGEVNPITVIDYTDVP